MSGRGGRLWADGGEYGAEKEAGEVKAPPEEGAEKKAAEGRKALLRYPPREGPLYQGSRRWT